jgi:hypothetical protein
MKGEKKQNKCPGQPARSTLDSAAQVPNGRAEPTVGVETGSTRGAEPLQSGTTPPDRFLVETVLAFPEASPPLRSASSRPPSPLSHLSRALRPQFPLPPTRTGTPRGRGSDSQSQQPRRPWQGRHGHSHFQWRLGPRRLRPCAPLLPAGEPPNPLLSSPLLRSLSFSPPDLRRSAQLTDP